MSELFRVLELVFVDRLGILLLLACGWLVIPFARILLKWVAVTAAVRAPAATYVNKLRNILASTSNPGDKARQLDLAFAELSRGLDAMRRGIHGTGAQQYALRVVDIRTREEEAKKILDSVKPVYRSYYGLLADSDDEQQRQVGRMYMEEERHGTSALQNP
jgi:hypothetical protein